MVFFHPDDQRRQKIPSPPKGKVAEGAPIGPVDSMQKTFESIVFSNLFNSEQQAKNMTIHRINEIAQEETDEELETVNPYNPKIGLIDRRGFETAIGDFVDDPMGTVVDSVQTFSPGNLLTSVQTTVGDVPFIDTGIPIADKQHQKKFHESMKKAYEKTGNDLFRTASTEDGLNKIVSNRVQKAEMEGKEAWERSFSLSSQLSNFGTNMATTILADPINTMTLPIGAGAGLNATNRVLLEGAINAGIEFIQQPDIQEGRREFGLKAGFKRGMANVAFAGAGGVGFQTFFEGLSKTGGKAVNEFMIRKNRKNLQNKYNLSDETADKIARQLQNGQTNTVKAREEVIFEGKNTKMLEVYDALHKANKKVKRMNPYENRESPDVEQGRQDFQKNLDRVQEDIRLNRTLRETKIDDSNVAVKQKETVIGERIDGNKIRPDKEFEDIGRTDTEDPTGRPVFYKNKDGEYEILHGNQARLKEAKQKGNTVEGIVIRENNDISKTEAKLFTLSRRFEMGEAKKEDIADLFPDADKKDIDLPARSMLGRVFKNLMRLDDNVYKNAVDENIPLNHMAVAGELLDDAKKQRQALDLLDGRETTEEARDLIQTAKKQGFEETDTQQVLNKRQSVLDNAIKRLDEGEETILNIQGEEVDITDERITIFRRMAAENKDFQRALTRASQKAQQEGSTRAGSNEVIEHLDGQVIRDPQKRSNARSSGDADTVKEQVRKGQAQRAINRLKESEGLDDAIKNREHEVYNIFEDADEEFLEKEIIHPRSDLDSENPENITVREFQEELKRDRKSVEEIEKCKI